MPSPALPVQQRDTLSGVGVACKPKHCSAARPAAWPAGGGRGCRDGGGALIVRVKQPPARDGKPGASVERDRGSSASKQHVTASVTCPTGIALKRGLPFYCVAQVGARITPFHVTQTDGSGHVTFVGVSRSTRRCSQPRRWPTRSRHQFARPATSERPSAVPTTSRASEDSRSYVRPLPRPRRDAVRGAPARRQRTRQRPWTLKRAMPSPALCMIVRDEAASIERCLAPATSTSTTG